MVSPRCGAEVGRPGPQSLGACPRRAAWQGRARDSDLSTWALVAPRRRNPPGDPRAQSLQHGGQLGVFCLSAGATLSGQHGLSLKCCPQWTLLWGHRSHSLSRCQQEMGKYLGLKETYLEGVSFLLLFFRQFRSGAKVLVVEILCLTLCPNPDALAVSGQVLGAQSSQLCAPVQCQPSLLPRGPLPVLS